MTLVETRPAAADSPLAANEGVLVVQGAELWPPLAASGSLPMMAHGPAHKRVDAPELNLASEYGRSYSTPRPTKQWGVGMATEYWTRNDGCIYKSSPMVCRDGYFDAIT